MFIISETICCCFNRGSYMLHLVGGVALDWHFMKFHLTSRTQQNLDRRCGKSYACYCCRI